MRKPTSEIYFLKYNLKALKNQGFFIFKKKDVHIVKMITFEAIKKTNYKP